RQPKAEGTKMLSDAPASGSDAMIANHLAWVLNDPTISQLGNDDLVQLIDALISLPSAVAASRATRVVKELERQPRPWRRWKRSGIAIHSSGKLQPLPVVARSKRSPAEGDYRATGP